jgi:hypothetical protein
MLKFFGVSKIKKLVVYTSNIFVERYKSKGVEKNKYYSFTGETIPKFEAEAAFSMKDFFNFKLPNQLNQLEGLNRLFFSYVVVDVLLSPRDTNDYENESTVITLGFPTQNNVSKRVEEDFQPPVKLQANIGETDKFRLVSRVERPGTSASGLQLGSEGDIAIVSAEKIYSDPFVSFVQKIKDEENDRFIFYVAGLCEHATAGGLYYLKENWKELRKKFGNSSSFKLILKISESNIKKGKILESKKFSTNFVSD